MIKFFEKIMSTINMKNFNNNQSITYFLILFSIKLNVKNFIKNSIILLYVTVYM